MLEGRETWVHTIKTPVRDTNGQIVGVLGVFWDITERKRADNALQRQTAELKARNEELMRFNDAVVGRSCGWSSSNRRSTNCAGNSQAADVSLGFLEAGSQAPIRAGLRRHEPTGEE